MREGGRKRGRLCGVENAVRSSQRQQCGDVAVGVQQQTRMLRMLNSGRGKR